VGFKKELKEQAFSYSGPQHGTSSHKTFKSHPHWMVLNKNWRCTVLQKLLVVSDVNVW